MTQERDLPPGSYPSTWAEVDSEQYGPPIYPEDIPGFRAWVSWHDFDEDYRRTGKGHNGYDYAAWVDQDNRLHIGLPPGTPIRAVAGGVVLDAVDGDFATYASRITIEHGQPDGEMQSVAIHVVPVEGLDRGVLVKKGDIIGYPYQDPAEAPNKRLVHLHQTLLDGVGTHGDWPHEHGSWQIYPRTQSPGIVDPHIRPEEAIVIPKDEQGFAPLQTDVASRLGTLGITGIVLPDPDSGVAVDGWLIRSRQDGTIEWKAAGPGDWRGARSAGS